MLRDQLFRELAIERSSLIAGVEDEVLDLRGKLVSALPYNLSDGAISLLLHRQKGRKIDLCGADPRDIIPLEGLWFEIPGSREIHFFWQDYDADEVHGFMMNIVPDGIVCDNLKVRYGDKGFHVEPISYNRIFNQMFRRKEDYLPTSDYRQEDRERRAIRDAIRGLFIYKNIMEIVHNEDVLVGGVPTTPGPRRQRELLKLNVTPPVYTVNTIGLGEDGLIEMEGPYGMTSRCRMNWSRRRFELIKESRTLCHILHPSRLENVFPFAIMDAESPNGNREELSSSLVLPVVREMIADMDSEDGHPDGDQLIEYVKEYLGETRSIAASEGEKIVISERVTQTLLQTDISKIMTDDLRLPYKSFFVGFDANLEIECGREGIRFEGAYIRSNDSDDGITMTFALSRINSSDNPVLDLTPPISVTLNIDTGLPLEDSVLKSLENIGLKTNSRGQDGVNHPIEQDDDYAGLSVSLARKANSRYMSSGDLTPSHDVVQYVVLLANALCLLSSYSDEFRMIDTVTGISEKKLMKMESMGLRKRSLVMERMVELGGTPIRYFDLSVKMKIKADTAEDERGQMNDKRKVRRGEVVARCLRRGHYRWQPRGPGRLIENRLWIEEKGANPEIPSEVAPRVYQMHDFAPEPVGPKFRG